MNPGQDERSICVCGHRRDEHEPYVIVKGCGAGFHDPYKSACSCSGFRALVTSDERGETRATLTKSVDALVVESSDGAQLHVRSTTEAVAKERTQCAELIASQAEQARIDGWDAIADALRCAEAKIRKRGAR